MQVDEREEKKMTVKIISEDELHEKNCDAGHTWVDAVKDRGGKMEDLDYPAFRQMLANANAPAWPVFENRIDEETARCNINAGNAGTSGGK